MALIGTATADIVETEKNVASIHDQPSALRYYTNLLGSSRNATVKVAREVGSVHDRTMALSSRTTVRTNDSIRSTPCFADGGIKGPRGFFSRENNPKAPHCHARPIPAAPRPVRFAV